MGSKQKEIRCRIIQSNKANNTSDVFDFLFREFINQRKFDKSKRNVRFCNTQGDTE